LPGTLAATLFLAAKFSGAMKVVSLEYKDKRSPIAVTASHGVLQEDQSEDIRWTQPGCAKVR
jgi:hypothetical protein